MLAKCHCHVKLKKVTSNISPSQDKFILTIWTRGIIKILFVLSHMKMAREWLTHY